MREYPAGRGAIAIEAKNGKVGITAVTKFGDGTTVYVEPDVVAEIVAALQQASDEATAEGSVSA